MIEPYIEALAERLAERLEKRRARMINQHESELGPRRHRAAVKRRMANGEGGAGLAGRNHLLTVEAVREELARSSARGKAAAVTVAGDARATKSRTRDLGDWEREVMTGLRAAEGSKR